jgi:hypothetical protein
MYFVEIDPIPAMVVAIAILMVIAGCMMILDRP